MKNNNVNQEKNKTAVWIINCDGYYPYCNNCGWEPSVRRMTEICEYCGCIMYDELGEKIKEGERE